MRSNFDPDAFDLDDLFDWATSIQSYDAERDLSQLSSLVALIASLGENSSYLEAGIKELHRLSMRPVMEALDGS